MPTKVQFSELKIGQCFLHCGDTYRKVKENWGQLVDADCTEETAIIQVIDSDAIVELKQFNISRDDLRGG